MEIKLNSIMKFFIMMTIIVLFSSLCYFSNQNSKLKEELNKANITILNKEKSEIFAEREGYKQGVDALVRLLWCDKQKNPPLEKCLGIRLEQDYNRLPINY